MNNNARGLTVRWSLNGRSFGLAEKGVRLLDVQMGLFCAGSASVVSKEPLG